MRTTERIARAMFGGGGRDITRRAVAELVPNDVLRDLGLAPRTSHLGGALLLVGTGIALGAGGYYVLGPQGAPVRARILAWMRDLRSEAPAAKENLSESPSDGASKPARHEQAVHS